jgi:SsrA-binding protein
MEKTDKLYIKNRKAYHEYLIIEEFIAGILLVGPEVKSIRMSSVSIKEAYCQFVKNELYIKSMHIAEYKEGTYNNVDVLRDRKLLLTKRELKKLSETVKTNGLTIIPLALFINERGLIKIKIALVKGKKLYDKRQTLKTEDMKRELKLNYKTN